MRLFGFTIYNLQILYLITNNLNLIYFGNCNLVFVNRDGGDCA